MHGITRDIVRNFLWHQSLSVAKKEFDFKCDHLSGLFNLPVSNISDKIMVAGMCSFSDAMATIKLVTDIIGAPPHFASLDWQNCILSHKRPQWWIDQHLDSIFESMKDQFRVVVTGDEREARVQAVMKLAHKSRIPVVCIPDINRLFQFNFRISQSLADAWILPSQELSKYIFSDKPPRIHCALNFDEQKFLSDLTPHRRQEIRSVYGVRGSKKIILHALQGFKEDLIVSDWLNSIVQTHHVQVVSRPHPAQNKSAELSLTGGIVSREFTSWESIHACDILVTHSSAMATQASLIGKLVILYAPICPLPMLLERKHVYWVPQQDEFMTRLTEIIDGQDEVLDPVPLADTESIGITRQYLLNLCAGQKDEHQEEFAHL